MDNWTENKMELGRTTSSPVVHDANTTIWVMTAEQKGDQVVLACSIAFGYLLFLGILMVHAAIGHVREINRENNAPVEEKPEKLKRIPDHVLMESGWAGNISKWGNSAAPFNEIKNDLSEEDELSTESSGLSDEEQVDSKQMSNVSKGMNNFAFSPAFSKEV